MHTGLGEMETAVPPHGSLADLDETLRRLLQDELGGAGMRGVEVTFEPPERDRVATWPSPALNLFLYDVREAPYGVDRSWVRSPAEAGTPAALARAPLRLECSFAITAWTRHALDEHRLLSQVLAILVAHPVLTADRLEEGLKVGTPPAPLTTRIAHGRPEGRADFWNAIGSPYKVSIEYAVTVLIVPGSRRARGGPAASAGITLLPAPAAVEALDPAAPGDLLAQGGMVRDAAGEPATGAWVLAPRAGRSAIVSEAGEFVLRGLAPGTHELRVRSADGTETAVSCDVPGPPVDVVLGT